MKNLQYIKFLVTESALETKHDAENEAVTLGIQPNLKKSENSRPGMTPTEEAVKCAPRWLGRASQSLRALVDCVMS